MSMSPNDLQEISANQQRQFEPLLNSLSAGKSVSISKPAASLAKFECFDKN